MSKSAKILITGATGNIGQELMKYLSAKGVSFRAMVRSVEKAKNIANLPGADLVIGDFNNECSLKKALTDIEKAFLLTNSSEDAEQQQCLFVETAKLAGVKHIVKLSQWAADANSPVRFLRYHATVENLIKESGMDYTFLRPNLFMQGLLGFRETIIEKNQFYGAIGNAKISVIDTRDIAAVAGETLTVQGHEGKIYNLTGPEPLTHTQMAEKISNAVGRKIEFIDIPSETLKDILISVGFPTWQADGLVEDYAHYKRGEASEVHSGVYAVTGREPRAFTEFAADYEALFTA